MQSSAKQLRKFPANLLRSWACRFKARTVTQASVPEQGPGLGGRRAQGRPGYNHRASHAGGGPATRV